MNFPPLPPWEGAHVLVVHFPIALLLVAPLLMLLAMLFPKRLPGVALTAWIVLLLGTFAAWVSVRTGELAWEQTGEISDAARAVMEQHKALGEKARTLFTGLCAAYGALLLAPVIFRKLKVGSTRTVGTLFLLLIYAWAALMLANASHLGGRLVHEFGLRVALTGTDHDTEAPPASSAAAPASQPAP